MQTRKPERFPGQKKQLLKSRDRYTDHFFTKLLLRSQSQAEMRLEAKLKKPGKPINLRGCMIYERPPRPEKPPLPKLKLLKESSDGVVMTLDLNLTRQISKSSEALTSKC